MRSKVRGFHGMFGVKWSTNDSIHFFALISSFKERGARYTLKMLTEAQRKAGVVAASAGNHALALSYHGSDLGIPVTVVMPESAPIMKVESCKSFGANVMNHGCDLSEAKSFAMNYARRHNMLYINGYGIPYSSYCTYSLLPYAFATFSNFSNCILSGSVFRGTVNVYYLSTAFRDVRTWFYSLIFIPTVGVCNILQLFKFRLWLSIRYFFSTLDYRQCLLHLTTAPGL